MNIKVKLINSQTHLESDDIRILMMLKDKIEKILREEFPSFEYRVKIYGELIPLRKLSDTQSKEGL